MLNEAIETNYTFNAMQKHAKFSNLNLIIDYLRQEVMFSSAFACVCVCRCVFHRTKSESLVRC